MYMDAPRRRDRSRRVAVHDDDVDEAVEIFIRTARTGVEGDGYVSVFSVDHRYNIRTGARDVS